MPETGGRRYPEAKSARSRYMKTLSCNSPSWYQESGQQPQRLKPHYS